MTFRLLAFVRVCFVLALLSSLALSELPPATAQAPTGAAAPAAPQASGLLFIENAGQFPDGARFQVRGRDLVLWLAEDALWLAVFDQGSDQSPTALARGGVNVKLTFPGANPHPRLEPFSRLATRVSYLSGSDPAGWQADVPAWSGVRYLDLYPGIDLELTGERGGLVPRVVARPGADLSAVRLQVEGAQAVALTGGALSLTTAVGEATLPLLRAVGVTAQPAVRPGGPLAFEVAAPFAAEDQAPGDALAPNDDPTDLAYSTFVGGSAEDRAYSIAVDTSGAAYITGATWSPDFPVTPGAFEEGYYVGYPDAFVAKVNVCGSSLEYATFMGGRSGARGYDIAVDGSGYAYITGDTLSSNFPTTLGAFDTSYNGGGNDAFVVKLNQAGSGLVYGTFLGGWGNEPGRSIAVDAGGSAYVTGNTDSSNFPTTPGAFDTSFSVGDNDAFVAKLNPAGSALTYSTYLGGEANDYATAIAVDGSGAAYVTGYSISPNFPVTAGAFDTALDGGEAFVAKMNAAGTGLVYATFLGGSVEDLGNGIAVDGSGAAYITGDTWSIDFPVTDGAYDTVFGDCEHCRDAFVAKLNAAGTDLLYATFLGGAGREEGEDIAVDGNGMAYVTGATWSADFPTTEGAFDTSYEHVGDHDAFMTVVNAAGTALDYSTFLGGSDYEWGDGVALDGSGAVYVAGQTAAADFSTTPGAFDTSYNGGGDGFVLKLLRASRSTYCIMGTVTDSGGGALPHITVSAGVGGSGITDSSGNYAIANVPAGTYTLTASLGGSTFNPDTRSVVLPPDAMDQDFVAVEVALPKIYLPLVLLND